MSLLTDLYAWYELGEASGTRVDSVGTIDLAPENSTTPGNAAGKVGNALALIQANGEAISPGGGVGSYGAFFNFGDTDFTFAVWVKANSYQTDCAIFSRYNATGTFSYMLYADSAAQRFIWEVGNGGTNGTVSADTFGSRPTGEWDLIVVSHDSVNNLLSISANGGALDTVSHSAGVATGDDFNSLLVGSLRFFGGVYPPWCWDGYIDQLGCWTRILTSDEIAALYNSGNGVAYADLGGGGGGSSSVSPIPQIISQAVKRAAYY